MDSIAEYLSPQDIRLDLDAGHKRALFDAVGLQMEQEHGLPHDWVVQSLSRREQAGSTGIGQGVAIPHARVNGIGRTLAAYIRLASAIPFDAPDGKPVSHVLVLLVPNPANVTHLTLLAEVTRLFSDPGFRKQLEASSDTYAIRQLFSSWHTRS